MQAQGAHRWQCGWWCSEPSACQGLGMEQEGRGRGGVGFRGCPAALGGAVGRPAPALHLHLRLHLALQPSEDLLGTARAQAGNLSGEPRFHLHAPGVCGGSGAWAAVAGAQEPEAQCGSPGMARRARC